MPPRSLAPVLVLAIAGCSLFVETEALQAGGGEATTTVGGGGATVAAGGGAPGSATSSAGGSTVGGGAEASGGAPGSGGAGASDAGGGGASATWCAANAPPDAFLCADFDTPTTGLSNPPWSNETFEDADGSVTLDDLDPRSPPASARVDLAAATEPNCGYQVLQRNVPGAPTRVQVRFAIRFDVSDGDEALVALFDWQTSDDVQCSLILGLGVDRGFLLEQAFASPSASDQWNTADSYLAGWHDVVWSIDLDEGTVELTVDGQPSFFVGHDDFVYDLGEACSDVAEPNTIHVRLGPHCENPPISLLFDDVIIAPW